MAEMPTSVETQVPKVGATPGQKHHHLVLQGMQPDRLRLRRLSYSRPPLMAATKSTVTSLTPQSCSYSKHHFWEEFYSSCDLIPPPRPWPEQLLHTNCECKNCASMPRMSSRQFLLILQLLNIFLP